MRKILLLLLISCFTNYFYSQEKMYLPISYIFNEDSLTGFDENLAKQSAFNDGFFGSEYKVYMYRAKRNFVNGKYNLLASSQNQFKYINANAATAACMNEDFELSLPGPITTTNQIGGWAVSSGNNNFPNNSCNLTGCCGGFPNASTLCGNGYIDPNIGAVYPIFSVFGLPVTNTGTNIALIAQVGNMYGNKFIKINDNSPNFGVHSVSKTFVVAPSNALFRFAFINVFYTGHPCCDAGAFQVRITNLTAGTIIACPSFSYSAPGASCPSTCTSNCVTYYQCGTTNSLNPISIPANTLVYTPWKLSGIDFTPFIGTTMQVEFISTDCTGGAHQGAAFVDAQCGAVQILANGIPVSPGNISLCLGALTTLSAPAGFAPYLWTGPGFSSVSQTINPPVTGTYTLTMGAPCLTTSQVFNIIAPAPVTPTILSTNAILCLGNSATLTANGITNYTWSTGANTSSIVISPSVSTTYLVNGTDTCGSPTSTFYVQSVSACTGLGVINQTNGFRLYPNPNIGEFNLLLNNEILNSELQIENALGQIIFSQAINKGENNIKTKNLAKGIYYYNVLSNKIVLGRGKILIE